VSESAAIATIEPPSVLGTLASHYGMDRRAFEETLKATIMPQGATREQTAAFLLVAKAHDLSPFTREIFAFPSKGGIQAVVSVDGWAKLMNSHPQFDGMVFEDKMDTEGRLVSITCKIHRKDRQHPVEVTEYMSECRRDTETWKRWPARMLRHKAAIQAARYAFGFAGILEPDEAERAQEVSAEVVPATLIYDERKRKHDEACEQYAIAVDVIKGAIAKWDETQDDAELYTIAEAWNEIPKAAQMDLWLAPTKGGTFTTHERDVIKTKLPTQQ
jgi:phage recombination protein Bet